MTVRKLKIAVIGTGGRAQTHLSTLPRLRDAYALCAVCDVDPARAEEVGARFGVPGYSDVVEMLERERPEVALIAVPPDGHHILTVRCAERGIHVLGAADGQDVVHPGRRDQRHFRLPASRRHRCSREHRTARRPPPRAPDRHRRPPHTHKHRAAEGGLTGRLRAPAGADHGDFQFADSHRLQRQPDAAHRGRGPVPGEATSWVFTTSARYMRFPVIHLGSGPPQLHPNCPTPSERTIVAIRFPGQRVEIVLPEQRPQKVGQDRAPCLGSPHLAASFETAPEVAGA